MKKLALLILIFTTSTIVIAQPETSAWSGVSYCIKDYLKENLHDPKSLDFQDAYKVTAVANGDYIQRVTYRAKNAFGGLVLEDQVFFMKRVYGEVNDYEVYTVWSNSEFKTIMGL